MLHYSIAFNNLELDPGSVRASDVIPRHNAQDGWEANASQLGAHTTAVGVGQSFYNNFYNKTFFSILIKYSG